MIKLPDVLKPLIDALQNSGANPVVVGGFIRDSILNKESKDIDIEVYNISGFDKMISVLKPFGSLNLVGKSFGVLKLDFKGYDIDFSLPRVEKKIASGHKGFSVLLDPKLTYKEAARRRDFTINSIGYEIKSGTLLDPYNGMDDLTNKVLAYVDKNTFIEDPLRVFRAAQFCARFDLTCKMELIELCRYLSDHDYITELPKERIYDELKKLLLKSKKPSVGLNLFSDFNLIKYFPELSAITNGFKYLDNMAKLKVGDSKTDMILMLSVLAFDFKRLQEVECFLHKLLNEKIIMEEILNLYCHKEHLEHLSSKEISNYDIYLLSTKVNINYLLIINEAREKKYEEIKAKARELNVLTCKPKPLLQGKDLISLGLHPSKKFSEILDIAYDAQLRELFFTHDDAKSWLQNHLKEISLYL